MEFLGYSAVQVANFPAGLGLIIAAALTGRRPRDAGADVPSSGWRPPPDGAPTPAAERVPAPGG